MAKDPPASQPGGTSGNGASDGGGDGVKRAGTWAGISNLNAADLGHAARTYGAAGFAVFPTFGATWDDRTGEWRCECGKPDCDRPAKHPRVRWTQAATSDADQIREWWAAWPSANIGIATGERSHVIVVDLDEHEFEDGGIVHGETEFRAWLEQVTGSEDWPPTLEVRTTGGGTHLYYADPGRVRVITAWLPGVDLRGDGGYVLAPPSRGVKRDGATYAFTSEDAPAALPRAVADRLRVARGSAGGGTRRSGGTGASASDYDYARAKKEGPPLGARDDFFNSYSYELWKAGASRDRILELVRPLWERMPNPPDSRYEWDTVVEKVNRVVRDVEREVEEETPVSEDLASWAASQVGGTEDPERPAEEPGDGPESDLEPDAELDNVVDLASRRAGRSGSGSGGSSDGSDGGGSDGTAGWEPGEYDFNTQLTEAGVAERFTRRFDGTLLFVPGMGWHEWDGVRWQPDRTEKTFHRTREVILDLAREQLGHAGNDAAIARYATFIERVSKTNTRRAILAASAADPRLNADVDELNADPWLLVVRNGTLDLRTGKVRPSDPADRCTQVAAVEYDEDATCPRWLEHVALVTSNRYGSPDPALAAFLQRWAGYTLTGLVSEQKFAFLFGGGSNGKNAFIETLMKVMGTYATTASSQVLSGGGQEHQTIIADLAGPRLVFVDETPRGRINEARLKQLTGTGRIRARKIAKDSFEFDARFKLWIAGNNKPRIAETSEGMWRRLDLVPFDAVIPAERRVKDYADLLAREEGAGILNWALEGLAAYRELGTLGPPERVLEATRVYREEEDRFGQFVHEMFDTAPRPVEIGNAWYPNRFIISLYKQWLHDEHGADVRNLHMNSLKADLIRHGFERDETVRKVRWFMGGSKAERGWFGPPLRVEVPPELAWS